MPGSTTYEGSGPDIARSAKSSPITCVFGTNCTGKAFDLGSLAHLQAGAGASWSRWAGAAKLGAMDGGMKGQLYVALRAKGQRRRVTHEGSQAEHGAGVKRGCVHVSHLVSFNGLSSTGVAKMGKLTWKMVVGDVWRARSLRKKRRALVAPQAMSGHNIAWA